MAYLTPRLYGAAVCSWATGLCNTLLSGMLPSIVAHWCLCISHRQGAVKVGYEGKWWHYHGWNLQGWKPPQWVGSEGSECEDQGSTVHQGRHCQHWTLRLYPSDQKQFSFFNSKLTSTTKCLLYKLFFKKQTKKKQQLSIPL